MPTPSLLIVPARFKTGTLYSQIPVPVAPSTSSVGDFTVTRNTTARRFNSAGLLESVASGIPRLDYFTSGGVTGCPALLVEPAATNLALHSRDLTNAVWSGTNVTTAKNAVGADGVASGATRLTATAASGTVLQAISNASQSRVFSAYVRRVTGTGAIQMTTNGGTNYTTVTISSLYTQVACAAQTVASGTVGFRMAVSGDVIEVDFTQAEVGPVATSPIVNAAASGSRSADAISVSGAVSGSIGQTEGTVYFEIDFTQGFKVATGFNYLLTLRSSGSQWIVFYIRANNNIAFEVANTVPAVSLGNNASGTITNGIFKVAGAYKSGEHALYVNGVQVGTSASTGVPTSLTQIGFHGEAGPGSNTTFGRVRAAALYTTRLTDPELATLTTL